MTSTETIRKDEFRFRSFSIEKSMAYAYILTTLFFLVYFMQITTLPYVVKQLEISSLHFGYIQTFAGALQIVGGPLFGYFTQKFGIRSGLWLAFGSTLISSVLLFGSYDLLSFFLSRLPFLLVQGQQVCQTLLSKLTNPGKERTNAFGRMGLAFGVGFMLVPIFSTIATYLMGPRGPLLASAAMCLVPILIMDKCTDERNYKENSENGSATKTTSQSMSRRSVVTVMNKPGTLNLLFKKNIHVAPMFLIFGIFQIYMVNTLGATQEVYSLIQMLIGLCFMFSNGFGVILFRKFFEEQTLILIGSGVFIVAYILFQFFTQLWMIVIIMPLATLGMSVISTVCDSMLTSVVALEEQGVILGVANAINAFVRTIGPAIGGVILESYGFPTFGVIGLVGTLLGMAACVLLPVQDQRKPHVDKEEKKEL